MLYVCILIKEEVPLDLLLANKLLVVKAMME